MFQGEPTTYRDKVNIDGGETVRSDPVGFYHGMSVKWGKDQYIMCGPESVLVAEPERPVVQPVAEQMSLFL
jgi:hypothetical protein